MKKLLVCGTRGKVNESQIYNWLNNVYYSEQGLRPKDSQEPVIEIIEGCCPNSADVIAEKWANENKVKINHYPATSGNYLKRNIEMVEACDFVYAFWDGFSYGTAHTIAQAVKLHKPVKVVSFKVKN